MTARQISKWAGLRSRLTWNECVLISDHIHAALRSPATEERHGGKRV